MKRFVLCLLSLILALGLIFIPGSPVLAGDAPDIEWIRQFGTSSLDGAHGVATDSTGIYVVGHTTGTLPGQSSGGGDDAFVRKYNADGNELWTSQFGNGGDNAHGVATDSTGIYVVGETTGTLPGQSHAGGFDAFVRKYNADGNELWTSQFGSNGDECAWGVATDSCGIYVVGHTVGTLPGQTSAGVRDAFVRKYNAEGDVLWTRQFGTSSLDCAYGVATDSCGIYVIGETFGTFLGQSNVGAHDAFVRKYNAEGDVLWTRQFGTSGDDYAQGVATDSTGIYVVGETFGTLPGQSSGGGDDAFVRKYNAEGDVLWTSQFGSNGDECAYGVATDSCGIYVVGYTNGTLPDQSSAGSSDIFMRKYNAEGDVLWTSQFGSNGDECAYGVATDSCGIYVVGYTNGTLLDQSPVGGGDAFIVKLGTLREAPQGSYIYSVKFLCGRAVSDNVGIGVEPADYATAINIHNFHDEAVTLKKKVVVAHREDEPVGEVTPYTDNVSLGPNTAIEVDCVDICGLLGIDFPPPTFIKGFVVIESSQPLNIVAVYTVESGRWLWKKVSIDVEQILPVISP